MFCINIKCMYPQYPSIFSNLYSTLILCEYLWLGWINSSYIYIYILLPNPWQPLFYFSCFFPRKLTRLGNPCWLKGIPTLVSNLIFFFPPWLWIFPRKVSGNLRLNTQTKPGLFLDQKSAPGRPPPQWVEWRDQQINLLTALHGLEESVPFCDYMVIYWWLEEIRPTSWSW